MTVNSGREMALLCPRARALPVPRQCLWGSNLSSLVEGQVQNRPSRGCVLCAWGGKAGPGLGVGVALPAASGQVSDLQPEPRLGGSSGGLQEGGGCPHQLQPELLALRSPLTPAITPLFVHCCFFFSVIWFLTRGQHPCARAY